MSFWLGLDKLAEPGGATVKIDKLTISGPGPTGCGSLTAGIFVVEDATLKIKNSIVTDMRDNPPSGCQNGAGIFVGRASYHTVGHAEISGVEIKNFQKGGIVVDNAGSTAKIEKNEVIWGLEPLNIASNGIQISRGASAVVNDNIVSGNVCGAPSCGPDVLAQTQSTGILLFLSGDDTKVINNKISDNDVGIFVYDSIVAIEHNKIIQNNNAAGMIFWDGTYNIKDNNISGPSNIGIAVVADGKDTVIQSHKDKINDAATPIATYPLNGFMASFEQ